MCESLPVLLGSFMAFDINSPTDFGSTILRTGFAGLGP